MDKLLQANRKKNNKTQFGSLLTDRLTQNKNPI